jgi:20S proteasome alpha/beta subunit
MVSPATTFYGSLWRAYRSEVDASPMTLIFGLLREDHIIFASDRRHVTGDAEERYINDHGWKTEKILGNTAMLGFSGNDFVEQIVAPLKRQGALEGDSLTEVARAVSKAAGEKFAEFINPLSQFPTLQLLLAGFRKENGRALATIYKIQPGSFYPLETCYDPTPGRANFEVIGKHNHGALYALHKCAAHAVSIEAGIQLAYFTLKEITRFDNTVGGSPQICVIRPDRELEDTSDNLGSHARWADDVGKRLQTLIVSPIREASGSRSKRNG